MAILYFLAGKRINGALEKHNTMAKQTNILTRLSKQTQKVYVLNLCSVLEFIEYVAGYKALHSSARKVTVMCELFQEVQGVDDVLRQLQRLVPE